MLLRKIGLLAFSPLAKLCFPLKQKTFSRGAENPLPSPCSGVLAGSGWSVWRGRSGGGLELPQAEEEMGFNSTEFPASFPFQRGKKKKNQNENH